MVVLIRYNIRNIGSVTNPNLPEEILEEIRRQYPPILTTAHVAEMMALHHRRRP